MDLKGAAEYNAQDTSPECAKDRIHFLSIGICALALLLLGAGITWCWNPGCGKQPYEAMARYRITELSQAVTYYELDRGFFPPGDGKGSCGLVECLRKPGPKKLPYMDFSSEVVDAGGNLINPARADKIIFYRYPGLHNPKSFDLWCEDAKGRADGINNWEK